MAITIVVPTRGRTDRLRRLVAHLRTQQSPDPFEVIVVVDGPDTATIAYLEQQADDARIRYEVRPVPGGPGAARNVGWRCAGGQVIAFIDDDCVPASGWLQEVTAAISAGDADMVQGRTEAAGPPLPKDQWTRHISVPRPSGRFETCNMAYRRGLLQDVGGFDEAFARAGEDVDLGRRALAAGARFAFAPNAVVEHDRVVDTFRNMLAFGTRAVDLPRLVRRHPEIRDGLVVGLFWDRRHAVAWAGLTILAALTAKTPAAAAVAGAAWVLRRSRRYVDAPPPRRLVLAAGSLAADVWEAVHTARGAVRDRTLLL